MAVECLESSRRDFYVLLAQRQLHVVGGQGVGGETRAVEPDAHGHAALAVDADIGDAGQILQAVAHVAVGVVGDLDRRVPRSEEHTSELQSLMRISYAVFCLKKKNTERKDIRLFT